MTFAFTCHVGPVDDERGDGDLPRRRRRARGREAREPRVVAVRLGVGQRPRLARDLDAREERGAARIVERPPARALADRVLHHDRDLRRRSRARAPGGSAGSSGADQSTAPARETTFSTIAGRTASPPRATIALISTACIGDSVEFQKPAAVRANSSGSRRHVDGARLHRDVERDALPVARTAAPSPRAAAAPGARLPGARRRC